MIGNSGLFFWIAPKKRTIIATMEIVIIAYIFIITG